MEGHFSGGVLSKLPSIIEAVSVIHEGLRLPEVEKEGHVPPSVPRAHG